MPATSMTTIQLHPMLAPVLPSAASAMALVNGEPGALPTVVAHTAMRAGIISVGLLISGQRQNVVRTALVSSLAIEAFVLGWAHWMKSRVPPPLPPPPVAAAR
jgi:hypothetical protein